MLAHASESQVRLRVAADQAASKHTGGSRNRGKGGHRRGPSERRTVEGLEMRTFGEEQVRPRCGIETRIRVPTGI
jgi:hypothetical protein